MLTTYGPATSLQMPVLTYLMWVMEQWVIDREARKIICENGGKYPVSLTEVMYLAREKSGCELRSTEHDYKLTKLLQAPRQDRTQSLSRCFVWLQNWTCTPTHTIARVMKLYEHLTPTKLYTFPKTGTLTQGVANGKCETLRDDETSIFLCKSETFWLFRLRRRKRANAPPRDRCLLTLFINQWIKRSNVQYFNATVLQTSLTTVRVSW